MTTLRERSHIILWTLLFFFVASMTVGGLVGGANILTVIMGQKNKTLNVGTIDGKGITRQIYEYEQRIQLNRLANNGNEVNEQTIISAGNSAWNKIIEDYIRNEKIEELNLTVYPEEVFDFLLNSPPAAFQKNITDAGYFMNDEGKFDLFEYQDAVRAGNLPEELRDLGLLWENYLKEWLADRKLRNIYNTLGSVSDAEVKDDYYRKNIDVTIDYIYINSSDIADSLIDIPESEIIDEYEIAKEERYKNYKSRLVEYILFPLPKVDKDSSAYSIELDSIMTQAYLISDEGKYSDFSSAVGMYSLETEDTLQITEGYSGNSGIPFNMGPSRKLVRFAFDSTIGSVSDPIEMKNGVAVFHIINETDESYKEIDEVAESIKRTILRKKKNELAKELLSNAVLENNSWETAVNSNDYFKLVTNQSGKINSTFDAIGKSAELEGALTSIDKGGVSNIIQTPTCFLYFSVKDKSIFNEEEYQEKYDEIKSQLQLTKKNSGYFKWLNSKKNELEIDDWRHEIY